MSHTPTPWVARPHDSNWGQYEPIEIVGADGRCIACNTQYYPTRMDPDNARFIVKAVNAHDDLVAALKYCLIEHGGYTIRGECERKAKAALAKAGEL